MAIVSPLTAEIRSGVRGTLSNFNEFVFRLRQLTAATSLTGGHPNFARRLTVSWAGTAYRPIHFRGLLLTDGILSRAKFILRPGLAFCYSCKRYCTALQERGQPKFAALHRGRHLRFGRAATTLGIGPDSSLKLHHGNT